MSVFYRIGLKRHPVTDIVLMELHISADFNEANEMRSMAHTVPVTSPNLEIYHAAWLLEMNLHGNRACKTTKGILS